MEVRSGPRGRGRRPTLSSGRDPGRRRRRLREAVTATAVASTEVAERLPWTRAPMHDEPSSPKRKHFFLASHYYDESGSGESLLTISHDRCNFLVLKPMEQDDVSFLDKSESSDSSSLGSQPAAQDRAPRPPSELSDIVDYALLNDTYSIHVADADTKLKDHFTYLSSEADLELQEGGPFFEILKTSSEDSLGLEEICKNLDGDYEEMLGGEMAPHVLDEDSQQEYHSAEEHDYPGFHLDFDPIKTLCDPNSEVIELGNSDFEIKCVSGLGENHVKKLESGPFFCEPSHLRTQGRLPEVSKFHDYLSLPESHGQKPRRGHEPEAGFRNPCLFDGLTQTGGSAEDADVTCGQPALPGSSSEKAVCPDPRKCQTTEDKDICAEEEGGSVLKSGEKPFLERISAASRQPSACLQNSTPCIFDESSVSAYDRSCYKFIHGATEPALDFLRTVPKALAKDSHLGEEDGPAKVAAADLMNKTHLISVESKYAKRSLDAACDCLVTVNQTIDASSDFRACFTTSRATSARSLVASRSSNTEITMMNKARPHEWLNEKQRSVACNTDWSCLASWAEEDFRLHGALPKGLEKTIPAESLKANDSVSVKDYLELKNKYDVKDSKKNPEGHFQPCKEVEKNVLSKCCQKTLQRAIRAELLLLKAHYQMCHQHCWKLYRLVMEEKESFTRHFASDFAKTELGSTLLSLFGDLKFKYLSMREKIIKGVPLDELPPLAVESRLLSFFSTFVPSKLMKEDSHIFLGPRSDLSVPGAPNTNSSAVEPPRALSQSTRASEHRTRPKREVALPGDSRKTRDLNVGIRNLRLDDEDYRKCQDPSEAWFDAKENLTGTERLEMPGDEAEPTKRSSKPSPEKVAAEPSRKEPDRSYLIHVGSLCPSVSETDLMSHFQKYQVSEVSICTSHNYRYASLVFKKANRARLAVEEMNGKEINGKSVNVRLVKTPAENVPPLSWRGESRPALRGPEPATDGRGCGSASVPPSKFPAHVPRLPEPENAYFSVDHRGGRKGSKPNKSVKWVPESPLPYVPPNTLNLGSFTKLLRKLEGLHPNVSRDTIIDALQEVRTNNKGFLSGLSLTAIVDMTTSVLRTAALQKEERKRQQEAPKAGIH
uniref:RNA binding motif protein 44 n=1 Tax=Monodelphis domestica TaxID=13616 RepID=F7GL94_MONDO